MRNTKHCSAAADIEGVSTIIDGITGLEYTPEEYLDKSQSRTESERFIKGPIPVSWLSAVIALGNPSAVSTALALHFQRGLCGRDQFKIEPARFRELGICKTARSRGLRVLEEAGLIELSRKPGQAHFASLNLQRTTTKPTTKNEET